MPLSSIIPTAAGGASTLGGLGQNGFNAGQYSALAGGAIGEIDAAGEANREITRAVTKNKLMKEGTDGAKEVA